jgi:glycosyltransferase involved in cell wall biosynthesis
MAAILDPPVRRILFLASIGMTLRQFVEPLAARLRADGFETIAAAADLGSLQSFDRTYELPQFRRRGPAAVLHAYLALTDVVRRERPVLLHLHTPPALVLGRLAGRQFRIPSVAVAHGSFLGPFGGRAIAYAAIEGALARLADHTATENAEDAAFYQRWAGARPVDVAPVGGLGLDLSRLDAAARRPRRIAAPPSVLVVGRLARDKNLDLAVNAFQQFRLRHQGATLTFLGSALPGDPGWEVPNAPGVRHQPWVPDPYPLIVGADLVVSASLREGFSLGAAEALALATPVAAVTNRGIRQLQRQRPSGLVASRAEASALAAAMEEALGRKRVVGERERLATAWSREAAIGFHRRIIYQVLGLDHGLGVEGA